jgi:hypothetical protein
MSIIFVGGLDKQAGETIGSIWRHTFYPYKLYLPLPRTDFVRLDTEMPNIVTVPVDPLASGAQRIDAALERCEGEHIAIAPTGFPVGDMWIENPLYALINTPAGSKQERKGFEPEGSTDTCWAVVVRKDDLRYARSSFPNLPVRQSLRAAGIVLRQPAFEELPFQFDDLLEAAQFTERNGNWAQAAQMFEYIADHHKNELWMKTLAARAFFKAGAHSKAAELSCEVNRKRPTVDTLLLEAKVNREKKNFNSAIGLLKRAKQTLDDPIWRGPQTH